MKIFLLLTLGTLFLSDICAQSNTDQDRVQNRFRIACNVGLGGSYTDKSILLNTSTSIDFDINLSKNYFLQFAPKYTYMVKWNEHYLTLPLHLGFIINKNIRVAAGPALSFDLGYFKDIGFSAGVYYHFTERSAVSISAFSFTLYDYHIDYLYIPIAVSYNLVIFK